MHYYLLVSETEGELDAGRELKFFEWLKHQEKAGRVREYWGLKNRAGLAAVVKMNFESELEEFIAAWKERAPAQFQVEPLIGRKAFESELAKKMLG